MIYNKKATMSKREILYELDQALNNVPAFFFGVMCGGDDCETDEDYERIKRGFIIQARPQTHIRFLVQLAKSQVEMVKNYKINLDKCKLERKILQGLIKKCETKKMVEAVKKLPVVNEEFKEMGIDDTMPLSGEKPVILDEDGNPMTMEEVADYLKNKKNADGNYVMSDSEGNPL